MKLSLIALRKLVLVSAFCALCAGAGAQTIIWSGGDATNGVSDNWSDDLNWTGGVLPGSANTVLFDNNDESGATGAASADNVVDVNFTIAGLWYAATNPSPNYAYHNTVINAGVSLTVASSNAAIVLDSGTQTDPDVGTTSSYSSISGTGTLAVTDTNSGSVMIVSQGSSTYTGAAGLWATLDMSDLDVFNGTFGRLLVGVQGVSPAPAGQPQLVTSGRQSGILTLADTNVIHLTQTGNIQGTGSAAGGGPALVINDSPFFGDDGSSLYLGQSNALFADTVTVGRIQCSRTAILEFNPNLGAPLQFYLRGESSNRVSELLIGDNTANGGFCNAPPGSGIIVPPGGFQVGSAGLMDVSAGTADIMVDTLIIGKGWNGGGGGYAAGILNMGAGTLNANTLRLGVISSAGAVTPSTGTLNISSGGTVIVNSNNLALGVPLSTSNTALAIATLSITNGTLNVANGAYGIVDGGQSQSTIAFDDATVTAANIGSASAPIGGMTLSDSTLNLAVNGLTGSIVTGSLTTDSASVSNTINIISIAPVAGLQTVITLISSGTPITFAGFQSDFVLGKLPPGFAGHIQVNGSSVQLILTGSPNAANDWTGAGIATHQNTNWSDGNNWSTGSEPGPGSPADFLTAASVSSSALSVAGGGPGAIVSSKINNIVDGNVSILGLTYADTNGAFQNTSIAGGDTLTVGLGGLTVGSSTLDFGNTTGNATITGPGGTLDVSNNSALFYVGLGHASPSSSAEATLDMSGLGTFNANVASFLVGVGSVGPASVLQPAGTVYLAQTNNITATSGTGASDSSLVALDIGDAGDAETTAGYGKNVESALYLGLTNAIFADYIDVGRQFASGGLFFNPAVTNSSPAVYIRGASAEAVASWNIGDAVQSTLTVAGPTGVSDFSGGTIDALVDTLQIGISSSNSDNASAPVTGTLTFDAGTIAADTVNISYNAANSGTVNNYAVGTVNVDGDAALTVSGTLSLASTGGPVTGGAAPTAILNISGGSVHANNLALSSYGAASPGLANAATSVINIDGGLLVVENGIGTPSTPLTSLNVTNAVITAAGAATPFVNVASVNSGGSSNVIILQTLPPFETYPATVVVLKSLTAIKGASNFKAVLPVVTNGPAYAGTLSTSSDSTTLTLSLTAGPVVARGVVYWTGPDGTNVNWSDATNWFLPPIPGPGDTAYFDNKGVSTLEGATGADNIVNTNATIAALWFAETNIVPAANYHNTLINSGVTLTISNNNPAIVLDSGTQTDADPVNGWGSCYNTISGLGALVVNDTNAESVAIVSQGSSTYAGSKGGDDLFAILDMSALNTFEGTFGRLLVGVQGVGPTPGQVSLNPSGRQAGQFSLALTNVIKLTQVGNIQGSGNAAVAGPALVINDSPFFGDDGSFLYWGQSNALYADTITVGRIQCSRTAVFEFNPNLATGAAPSFYLRGFSSDRVSEMILADNTVNPNTGNAAPGSGISVPPGGFEVGSAGVVDFSAGTSDMMIDTLIIGKGYNGGGGGYAAGLFNLGAGTLNANTVSLGALSSTNTDRPATGTLNIAAGGTVTVNGALALGQAFGGGASRFAYGALNVNGGTVSAAGISSGGNSVITTTGGTITLTSPAGSIGTSAAPIASVTFGGATTLNLAVGSSGSPVVASNFTGSGSTDTINISELPPITSTVIPASVTLIQSSTPIANYSFVLGSLPLGFKGTLKESSDSTLVQLLVSGAPIGPTNAASISAVTYQPATGSIVITATKGAPGGEFVLLTSTSLALPLAGWTPVITSISTFDASGNATVTIPYSPSDISRFYVIKQ